MMLIKMFFLVLWSNVLLAGIDQEWNRNNSPFIFPGDLITHIDSLSVQGLVRNTPWGDHYWGDSEGGIGLRWQFKDRNSRVAFLYHSYSLNELKRLSENEVALLSPAEKYDIMQGRYDYPLLSSEISRTSPHSPPWYGLCDGLSSSSIMFSQPGTLRIKNTDGIILNFYSSDIKALLTYYMSIKAPNEYYFVGERCLIGFIGPCDGVNAGSFHVLLSNFVGLKGQSIIADLNRDKEVWNYAISSYSSVFRAKSSISATAAYGTVKEYYVTTSLNYIPHIRPQKLPTSSLTKNVMFNYTVELDQQGRIIGGEWISQNRPDFIWLRKKKPVFTDYFKLLEHIYNQSLTL